MQPAQKQFKRHILSFVPSAKIESVRYRSVAFKKPTAELPDDSRKTSHANKPSKPREHDRDRAAAWRANEKDDNEAAAAPQSIATFPTTVITKTANTVSVDPSVLATSNGDSGKARANRIGGTSQGGANAAAPARQPALVLTALSGALVGALGVLARALW